jgi:hypothetical protein
MKSLKGVVVILSVLVCASLEANPLWMTFLNEISVGMDDMNEWIELHSAPESAPVNILGWSIVTTGGTAVITLDEVLGSQHIVINSSNTSGVFTLDDVEDTLYLLDEEGDLLEVVVWGYDGWFLDIPMSGFPTPPDPFISASRFNETTYLCDPYISDQYISWYFDFTPTPGDENDGTGVIWGTVSDPDGALLGGAVVVAEGPYGYQSDATCSQGPSTGTFMLLGLGAGPYWVTCTHSEYGSISYGDSIYLGAGDTIFIELSFAGQAIEERKSIEDTPLNIKVVGREVVAYVDEPLEVRFSLYDASGRFLERVFQGVLFEGTHFFKLANYPTGVYFLKLESPKVVKSIKLMLP